MNRLDRLIEYISPETAARRARARTVLQASQRGAIATRTATGWGTSISYRGGTSASRVGSGTMRDRARNAYANNAIAKSLLESETDYVIADGMKLQSRTEDKEFNREVEQRFAEWMEVADVRRLASASDLYRASWREPRKDGDGGFVLIGKGLTSQLQYIPGDRIQSPWGMGSAIQKNGALIQDGVETDTAGRPIAFHIIDETELGKITYTRVDARDFVYLPNLEAPLDLRGTTVYSPIFELLDQVSGYVDAVVIAARMAAVFGLIFKGDNTGREMSQLTTLTNSQGTAQKAITLENGMIRMIGAMDDVVQVQASQPMSQTTDFTRTMFRLLCLPFGLPLELGMKDVSQVTFISGRLGLQDAARNFKQKQCWIRSRCWYRIYEWWIARERKKQQLGLSDFVTTIPEEAYLYEFQAPAFPIADELNQNQSDLLAIDMGVKTPQMVAGERGRDWTDMQDDLADAKELRDELELPEVRSSLTRDAAQEPAEPVEPAESEDPNQQDNNEDTQDEGDADAADSEPAQ